MSLKIFKGGELYEEGERRQLFDMIDFLQKYFDERDNNVYLLVDPQFQEYHPQIDCLFYRQGKIVVLELKNIHGKFIPVVEESKQWLAVKDNGSTIEIQKSRINPFCQVKKQRGYLINYLIRQIYLKPQSKYTPKEIGSCIGGWIVTARNSQPEEYDNSSMYWSGVFPIGESLLKRLSMVGTSSEYAISEDEFIVLLNKTQSVEISKADLFYRGVVPNYEHGKVPTVEMMIQRERPEEMSRAIKYCRELNLIGYFDELKASLNRVPIMTRREIYSILYEWLNNFPQKFGGKDRLLVVRSGLKDSDMNIRSMSLSFLVNGFSVVETELQNLIWKNLQIEKDFVLIELSIFAMGQAKNKKTVSEQLESFYRNMLQPCFFYWGKEFYKLNKSYGNKIDRIMEQNINRSREETYANNHELEVAKVQFKNWEKITKAWLSVTSSLSGEGLGEIVLSHAKRVLEELGQDRKNMLLSTPTLEESINTLGKIKPKGTSEFLRSLLNPYNSEKILLSILNAFGNIGDKEAVNILMKFLEAEDLGGDINSHLVKIESSDALSKIGYKESFDMIWNLFLKDTNEHL